MSVTTCVMPELGQFDLVERPQRQPAVRVWSAEAHVTGAADKQGHRGYVHVQ